MSWIQQMHQLVIKYCCFFSTDEYFQKPRPNSREMSNVDVDNDAHVDDEDDDYRDVLDYVVEDLEGQKSKLLLTPQNSATATTTVTKATSSSMSSRTSTTLAKTSSIVSDDCQVFLIIGGVLGGLLVTSTFGSFFSLLFVALGYSCNNFWVTLANFWPTPGAKLGILEEIWVSSTSL